MTLEKNPPQDDLDRVILKPGDSMLLVRANGIVELFSEAGDVSDVARAVMFMALSIQMMGVGPLAQRYDNYCSSDFMGATLQ